MKIAELPSGARLGPYELLAPAGVGGMGQVYRARDTRLGREVAIKILASHVAAGDALKKRFLREARAISALNHPHICALYDIGREEGHDFLVMEYLDGETLAQRLERGALPFDEALGYAIDIASALELAHRKGIIHRDLKPSNVMLTTTGAKLLDFGVARLAHADESRGVTGEGLAVGTVAYMAPEQINGTPADARTDIFAFGAVLYEMVMGRRPFDGENTAAIVGAILFSEPAPMPESDRAIAPLARLIAACIDKNPDDRIQTSHDLKLQLQWMRAGGAGEWSLGASARRRTRLTRASLWILGVAAMSALAVWVGKTLPGRISTASAPPTISTLQLSSSYSIPADSAPAISPDGRNVAVVVVTARGTAIAIRGLGDPKPRLVPSTESAVWTTWSPNSRHLLFATEKKIARVDTATGSVTMLADAADPRGATENTRGDLIYAPTYTNAPLTQIPAEGGKPRSATTLRAGETSHRWPQFLPDGKHFLYFAARRDDDKNFGQICVGSIDGTEGSCLLPASSQALFLAPDLLMYDSAGVVNVYEFDPASRTLKRPLSEMHDVDVYDDNAFMRASASTNGLLTYVSRTARSLDTLQWIDRSGKVLSTLTERTSYESVELSHDGQRLAVAASGDIWIYDLQRGVPSRITTARAIERNPIWSPDDRQIAYNSSRPGHYETRIRSATPAPDDGVHVQNHAGPVDWSADGRYLAMDAGTQGRSQILVYSVHERTVTPATRDRTGYGSFRFSPDGKWIAYTSNIGGTTELYVDSFPNPSERRQVSASGGEWPRWRKDGKELFFVSASGHMNAVSVDDARGRLRLGVSEPLFDLGRVANAVQYFPYDVSADGKRFIAIRRPDADRSPITLVTNWISMIGR